MRGEVSIMIDRLLRQLKTLWRTKRLKSAESLIQQAVKDGDIAESNRSHLLAVSRRVVGRRGAALESSLGGLEHGMKAGKSPALEDSALCALLLSEFGKYREAVEVLSLCEQQTQASAAGFAEAVYTSTLLRFARRCMAAGKLSEAIRWLESGLAENPHSTELRRELARCHMRSQDFYKAEKELAFLAETCSDTQASESLGLLALQSGRPEVTRVEWAKEELQRTRPYTASAACLKLLADR